MKYLVMAMAAMVMGDGLMVEVPRKSIVTDSAVGWKLLEDSPKIHGFLAGELARRERQHHPPPTSGHKIVRNHKIVRLRILTSSLLANRRFVLNARGARSTEDQ